jgi:hypothetical protein
MLCNEEDHSQQRWLEPALVKMDVFDVMMQKRRMIGVVDIGFPHPHHRFELEHCKRDNLPRGIVTLPNTLLMSYATHVVS